MTRKRQSREPLKPNPPSPSSTEEVVQLPAVGCSGCGRRAAAHVRRLAGVSGAVFDPIERQLHVTYDDLRVDGKVILAAISGAGVDADARRIAIPLTTPIATAAQAEAIERILLRLAGVVSAHADPISQTVTVTYAMGVTGASELKAALTRARFLDTSSRAGRDARDLKRPGWRFVLAFAATLIVTLLAIPFPWASIETIRAGVENTVAIPAVPFSPLEVQVSIATLLLLQTFFVTRNRMRRFLSAARAGVIDEGASSLIVIYGMVALAIAMLVRTGNGFVQFLESSSLLTLLALDDVAVARLLRKLPDDRTAARPSPVEARARRTERRTAVFAAAAALAGAVLVYQLLSDVSAAVTSALSVLASLPLFTLFAAAPAAMASTRSGGIVFRDSNDLERMATAGEVILLDGAIRDSDPVVSDSVLLRGTTQQDLLQAAAGATGVSERPVARALRRRAGPLAAPGNRSREIDGIGWEDDNGVVAGFEPFLARKGIDTAEVADELARFRAEGKIAVLVARGETLIGIVALDQTPAADAATMVADLRKEGMTARRATTQEAEVTSLVAKKLGIGAVDSEARIERLWKVVAVRGAETIVICSAEEVGSVASVPGVVVSLGTAAGAAGRVAAGDRAAIALAATMARRATRVGKSAIRLAVGSSLLLTVAAISWPFALGFDPPPLLFAAIMSVAGWSILRRCVAVGMARR